MKEMTAPAGEVSGGGDHFSLLAGGQTGTDTTESSVEVPQKVEKQENSAIPLLGK